MEDKFYPPKLNPYQKDLAKKYNAIDVFTLTEAAELSEEDIKFQEETKNSWCGEEVDEGPEFPGDGVFGLRPFSFLYVADREEETLGPVWYICSLRGLQEYLQAGDLLFLPENTIIDEKYYQESSPMTSRWAYRIYEHPNFPRVHLAIPKRKPKEEVLLGIRKRSR
jgi:hypothetical protein